MQNTENLFKKYEKLIWFLVGGFSLLVAVFRWIDQPAKNAEKLQEVNEQLADLRGNYNELKKDYRDLDRQQAKAASEVEAVKTNIAEIKSDVREIRNVVLGYEKKKYN